MKFPYTGNILSGMMSLKCQCKKGVAGLQIINWGSGAVNNYLNVMQYRDNRLLDLKPSFRVYRES